MRFIGIPLRETYQQAPIARIAARWVFFDEAKSSSFIPEHFGFRASGALA
jgi:hypothetical protein